MSEKQQVDVREVMSKLTPSERNRLILQVKAYENYGEKGEDLAIDLLFENPNLTESELFQQIEAEMSK
ncbi:MAG: hypothetical protein LC768_16550 [Acidobacteria bacterium]|nr:hypothetical protein [Acidobacteriota bacterium]